MFCWVIYVCRRTVGAAAGILGNYVTKNVGTLKCFRYSCLTHSRRNAILTALRL